MPYYLINKQPIFLSTTRYRELEKLVTKDKDIMWIGISCMAGSKETKEKSELMFNALNKIFLDNPDYFNSYWVDFDLKDKEASENTWDLIYDYCHFYGNASLSDDRDFSEKLKADYERESINYPMGRVFTLNLFLKSRNCWWTFSPKRRERIIQVIINTDKVNHLKGNLKEFIVYADDWNLICGENFQIDLNK